VQSDVIIREMEAEVAPCDAHGKVEIIRAPITAGAHWTQEVSNDGED